MRKVIFTIIISSSIYAGGVFSVGHKNISITAGTDSAFGNTYTVIGVDGHYFVADNLSVGASYQTWLGDNPTINQITIPVTYHLPIEIAQFRPYIGGFYSKTFISDNYDDYNSYGCRFGVTMLTSKTSYISFGWVQEINENGDDISSRSYPEVSAGVSF